MSDLVMQIVSIILGAVSVALFGWLISILKKPTKWFTKIDEFTEKYLGDSGSNKFWDFVIAAAENVKQAAEEMKERDSFPKSESKPEN